MSFLELVAKLRVIASDEEKAPAGSFFDRRFWSKNVPRGDFDEVSRDKTHFSNKLLKNLREHKEVVAPSPPTASSAKATGEIHLSVEFTPYDGVVFTEFLKIL